MEREINVRVRTEEQLKKVQKWGRANRIFLDAALLSGMQALSAATLESLKQEARKGEEHFYVSLPDIARDKSIGSIKECLRSMDWLEGAIVKNLDELGILQEIRYPGEVVGDSLLYAYNREAIAFYLELFPQMQFLLSDELTDREMKQMTAHADLRQRMIYKVYGHQQLMVTAQCLSYNYTGCREKVLSFRDEKRECFYAVSECSSCISHIYNGKPTWMLDKPEEILYPRLFLDFTLEDGETAQRILEETGWRISAAAGQWKEERKDTTPAMGPITRGHHYAGIE